MTQPVRIGVLGTGKIAARALIEPALSVPEVQVTSVASRVLDRAERYAQGHGLRTWSTYDGLLDDPEIDVVYITLPPSLHAEWSIKAMEAGKDVLCEKPIAANAAEARAIDAAAIKTGRIFIEAFHYHHHPLARRVRDLVNARAVGEIERVTASFLLPRRFFGPGDIRFDSSLAGGVLMDAGCYCLHAIRHLLGEPRGVDAATAVVSEDDPGIDLSMTVDLGFDGGVTASAEASFLREEAPETVLEVQGTRGRIAVSSLYAPQWGGRLTGNWDGHSFDEAVDPTPSYVFQLQELVRCVRGGSPVITSAADGVATMKLIDACYAAAGMKPRQGSTGAC